MQAFRLDPKKRTLFIFGGSQGSRNMNLAVLDMLERLMADPCIQILWRPVPWYADVTRKTRVFADRIRVLPFIGDMGSAYGAGRPRGVPLRRDHGGGSGEARLCAVSCLSPARREDTRNPTPRPG